ncbi:hypothetical protein AB0399_26185 [Streptomyces sp. NPDC088194]|uniref:hypothetical protein n=1 Tax=Streptomyces sp. NPDC088194 TaxID=3154931 RepID=UPI0034507147
MDQPPPATMLDGSPFSWTRMVLEGPLLHGGGVPASVGVAVGDDDGDVVGAEEDGVEVSAVGRVEGADGVEEVEGAVVEPAGPGSACATAVALSSTAGTIAVAVAAADRVRRRFMSGSSRSGADVYDTPVTLVTK